MNASTHDSIQREQTDIPRAWVEWFEKVALTQREGGPDDGGFDVYATKSTDYAGSSQPIQVTITEDSGQSGSTTATFSDNSLTVDAGSTVTVSALPSSAVVTNDGVLAFDGSGTQNFSGAISGTGVVIVSGGGTFAATPQTF